MGIGAIHRTRLTGDRGDARVSQWLKPLGIKSVQSFTIDLTGATTATATITAVNTTNSFVIFLGSTSALATAVNRDIGRITLTNATTVTATQDAGHGADPLVSGMVVECWPGTIKSVQQGTITISTAVTTGTATINSVTVGKAFVLFLGFSGNIGDATNHAQATGFVQLTNATTVTWTLGGAAGGGGALSVTGSFVVVEGY